MSLQQRLRVGTIRTGFCPVCLNDCHFVRMNTGGRKFGMKHVGERVLSIYGELVWDKSGVVYWHMSVEPTLSLSDDELLSHLLDDLQYSGEF